MRAQRDEPIRLDTSSSAQDLFDRRAQIVETDLLKHAAEPLERLDVQLKERLLGLNQRRLAERRARERRTHQKQVNGREHIGEHDLRLAPVDLATHPGRVDLRHEHLPERPAHRAPARTHIVTHRRLRHVGAVLVDQPCPDPLRRVTLLARRLEIPRQPTVDQRPVPTQLRRRPTNRRTLPGRQRRDQRLPDRPPMHPMTLGKRPDRQALTITVPPDLLEQLHPRTHPSRRLPLELQEHRTVGDQSDGGGASSNRRSGATSNRRSHETHVWDSSGAGLGRHP
jgi:hypothetical protein